VSRRQRHGRRICYSGPDSSLSLRPFRGRRGGIGGPSAALPAPGREGTGPRMGAPARSGGLAHHHEPTGACESSSETGSPPACVAVWPYLARAARDRRLDVNRPGRRWHPWRPPAVLPVAPSPVRQFWPEATKRRVEPPSRCVRTEHPRSNAKAGSDRAGVARRPVFQWAGRGRSQRPRNPARAT